MNTLVHGEIGFCLAHLTPLPLRERRLVAFGAMVADLDGLSLLGGAEAFESWHRTVGHSLLAALVASAALASLAGRGLRRTVLALAFMAALTHLAGDAVYSGWGVPLIAPFDAHRFALTAADDYDMERMGLINGATQAALLLPLVLIYRRHRRSPLEVASVRVDRLLSAFVVLPWTTRCRACGKRAFYRCEQCGAPCCPRHRRVGGSLAVVCAPLCPEPTRASPGPPG